MTRSDSRRWKTGDPVHSPLGIPDEWNTIRTEAADPGSIYRWMTSTVLPRPIAFISTASSSGVGNLAPFSYFNAVASNPPTLMVSITPKRDGSPKDTLRNIRETGEFTVNLVAEWMLAAMNQCSAEYPYGVDEMREVGLTPIPSEAIVSPRVAESPVQFECVAQSFHQVGEEGTAGSSTVVFGRILRIHVHPAALKEGRPDFRVLRPVARLGGADYALPGDVLSLPRPVVPDQSG